MCVSEMIFFFKVKPFEKNVAILRDIKGYKIGR